MHPLLLLGQEQELVRHPQRTGPNAGRLVNTPGSFDSNHDRIKGHGFLAQTERERERESVRERNTIEL